MKERFGLYLIASNPVAGYEILAKAAVECGVRYLQLRMKGMPRERVADTAFALRSITRGSETRFIVNDDLSVAMEVDADGVHLGQGDASLAEARERWDKPGKIYGLSTHGMQQASLALALEPDYIGIGPVFPTQTKADADPALGPEKAGRIIKEIPISAVGIGGIHAGNLEAVLECGIENFCVVGAVAARPDPAAAIRELQKIWKNHLF